MWQIFFFMFGWLNRFIKKLMLLWFDFFFLIELKRNLPMWNDVFAFLFLLIVVKSNKSLIYQNHIEQNCYQIRAINIAVHFSYRVAKTHTHISARNNISSSLSISFTQADLVNFFFQSSLV